MTSQSVSDFWANPSQNLLDGQNASTSPKKSRSHAQISVDDRLFVDSSTSSFGGHTQHPILIKDKAYSLSPFKHRIVAAEPAESQVDDTPRPLPIFTATPPVNPDTLGEFEAVNFPAARRHGAASASRRTPAAKPSSPVLAMLQDHNVVSAAPPAVIATPPAPAPAASTTTAVSTATSSTTMTVRQLSPLVSPLITISRFLVTVPCLPDVQLCVEFVQRFHAATIDPDEFDRRMKRDSHAVIIKGRNGKKDVRDQLTVLYRTRHANLAVALEKRTQYFNSTQQFACANVSTLLAMYSSDASVRKENAQADHHLMCAFCKNEFSLRNNAYLYVAKSCNRRPHEHPSKLHPFLKDILDDGLWMWAPVGVQGGR